MRIYVKRESKLYLLCTVIASIIFITPWALCAKLHHKCLVNYSGPDMWLV